MKLLNKNLILGISLFMIGALSNVNAQTVLSDAERQSIIAQIKNELKTNPLTFSGYVDAYYAYYSDSVGYGNFQKFPTTSPRSNSFGLNIAMVTAKYTTEKIRSIVTLHYGDLPMTTWSSKYNFIQEANIGVRLYKTLWLDAGFFRTHVGTEGLLPKENIAASIAIGTFNEPYYQAGCKLSFAPTDKLLICLHLLNGYNIFEDNNEKKSLGLLLNYTVNDNIGIGYSNYIGDDSPAGDSVSHLRNYHNLYLNFTKNKLKIQIGGDFGMQQNSDSTGNKTANMFSAVAAARYAITPKFGLYTRGEIFNDPSGFLSGIMTDKAGHQTGLKLWGATLGIEYKITDNSYIRMEGRQLQCDSNQEIFRRNGNNSSNRMEVMVQAGVSF
ncbi:MAG: outer membrane beta-barrel protein [Saprospiraceae bacterium]